MKIVCDNCATKYSIADEKVRGKVFKIRCKKCSHIIVVRGADGAAAGEPASDAGFPAEEPSLRPATQPSPAAAPLGTGEAVWHLVVDREQIGPLTREEVQAKFRAGEVDLETYAWREGFADWLRLGSIEDFRGLASEASGEGATRRTDTADLFATSGAAAAPPPDDGPSAGDLFGGHNAPSAPTGEAPMPANDMFAGGSKELFGAPQAQAAAAPARAARSSAGGGAAMAAAAEPAAAEAPAASGGKMTGQRNENSVLFSLNNLQALASGGAGGGASKAASSGPAEPRPGFASSQTEGSGLIDIRAMAASTLSAGPSSPGLGGKSDEPSFSSAPLFSPVAAPILMPAPAAGPPKWIWGLVGGGVMAVVLIVVLGVMILTKKEPPPVVAAVPPPVAVNPPVPNPAQPNPAQPNPAVANPATNPAPNAPANPPPADAPKDDHHHHSSKHDAKGTSPSSTAPAAAAAAPAANPKAPAPKKKGGNDELDDLLNGAAPDRPAPAAKHSAPAESSGGADLPDSLSKSDIVSGMGKVKGNVANCYAQFKVPGLANVSVTIGKNGRVSSASVSGSFAGTPTGSCVEKAVKSASFPPVKGSPTTINYPFMLR
jgi:predicted Zn finger-like uncharacterized protein